MIDRDFLTKLHFTTNKLIAMGGHHFYVKVVRIIQEVLCNVHEINEDK